MATKINSSIPGPSSALSDFGRKRTAYEAPTYETLIGEASVTAADGFGALRNVLRLGIIPFIKPDSKIIFHMSYATAMLNVTAGMIFVCNGLKQMIESERYGDKEGKTLGKLNFLAGIFSSIGGMNWLISDIIVSAGASIGSTLALYGLCGGFVGTGFFLMCRYLYEFSKIHTFSEEFSKIFPKECIGKEKTFSEEEYQKINTFFKERICITSEEKEEIEKKYAQDEDKEKNIKLEKKNLLDRKHAEFKRRSSANCLKRFIEFYNEEDIKSPELKKKNLFIHAQKVSQTLKTKQILTLFKVTLSILAIAAAIAFLLCPMGHPVLFALFGVIGISWFFLDISESAAFESFLITRKAARQRFAPSICFPLGEKKL